MKLKTLAIFLFLFVTLPVCSLARPMITDLSERRIDIDARFTGKEILLYGARVEAGDIVIVIRGPEKSYVVRRKEKVGPIWINKGTEEFQNVPQYYMVASSKDITKLAPAHVLEKLGLGVDNLDIKPITKIDINSNNINKVDPEYKQALLDFLKDDNLYDFSIEPLQFMEQTLFRLYLEFPEKITRGTYVAEVYSFNNGRLQGMQTIPIKVDKVGIEADIYDLAHNYPWAYGILAIFIAMVFGWLASIIFRKV